MQQTQDAIPPMSNKTMIGMLIAMAVMIVVMQFRDYIGPALDHVFRYVAFDGAYPVLTLVIAGIMMIAFSTVVRTLMTNPIEMAKTQQIQSDFNAEFRQARIENNLFKMKKLQEQQPQMMAASMEASTNQMKIMPVTMIVLMPVYAWVYYFLKTGDGAPYFDHMETLLIMMPWGEIDLNSLLMNFLPVWVVIYTMVSLPIGQVLARLIRFILLKKRLDELDREVKRAEIE